MAIENITSIFPLINNIFVIAIFSIQLYIAKVIAMYEQKDKFHSYITRSITDIQDLSYISLQVFTYIQGHIFAEFDADEHYLFSHCEPKQIVYNIEKLMCRLKKIFFF